MEWLKKLGKAIDYIEDNLDKEISYDEAARIACCSPYYFQRVFSYVSGVSLAEYIRRRKMTQAAFELQRADSKVIDVALKYGYSSPTSFNRAFQNVHGITPTAAKLGGNVLQAYPSIQFKIEITGGSAMAYRIAQKPPLRIVGIRIPLTSDMEDNLRIVPEFWKALLQGEQFLEICKLSNEEPRGILGISVYRNPKEIYYYIGVATNSSAPAGMYECEIPAATWVIFENDGRFKEDVQSVFKRFYMEWLPFSGYKYAELPDIEVYPICSGQPVNGHSEVWIAVVKEDD